MQYIEAPSKEISRFKSVFLGGGISGCPDWQAYVADRLADLDVTVYNPRRKNFPMDNPNASEHQIRWEYERIRTADVMSFWFPKETLCPITLFELGAALERGKPLAVGSHPDYPRKLDIEIQIPLRRQEVKISHSLEKHAKEIRKLLTY